MPLRLAHPVHQGNDDKLEREAHREQDGQERHALGLKGLRKHVDVRGEYSEQEENQAIPGEPAALRDEQANAAETFEDATDIHQRERVRQTGRHYGNVKRRIDEMHDAGEREERGRYGPENNFGPWRIQKERL